MNNTNIISIISQAFYGNRVETEIDREKVDAFILGHIDGDVNEWEKVDRTIINLPNLDGIVLVYNKHNEERVINRDIWVDDKWDWLDKEWLEKTRQEELKYELKPTAIIPELDLTLYSKCIVCRVDENNNLVSLEDGDYEKFEKYLAE